MRTPTRLPCRLPAAPRARRCFQLNSLTKMASRKWHTLCPATRSCMNERTRPWRGCRSYSVHESAASSVDGLRWSWPIQQYSVEWLEVVAGKAATSAGYPILLLLGGTLHVSGAQHRAELEHRALRDGEACLRGRGCCRTTSAGSWSNVRGLCACNAHSGCCGTGCTSSASLWCQGRHRSCRVAFRAAFYRGCPCGRWACDRGRVVGSPRHDDMDRASAGSPCSCAGKVSIRWESDMPAEPDRGRSPPFWLADEGKRVICQHEAVFILKRHPTALGGGRASQHCPRGNSPDAPRERGHIVDANSSSGHVLERVTVSISACTERSLEK